MKEYSILELKQYLDLNEMYIAHYDFMENKGVLNNGDSFKITSFDGMSIENFRYFLRDYEKVRDIKSIKDALIESIQKFKSQENKKIFDVIQKIIRTDSNALNVDFIAKDIDSTGIDNFAADIFKKTSLTYTDKLSRLFNANFYHEYLEPEDEKKQDQFIEILSSLGITTQEALFKEDEVALVYMDLDNLKAVNDKISHLAGDRAIEAFGNELLKIRMTSLPIRAGGDEFVLLCKKEDAERIVETIQSEEFIENINDELCKHIREEDKDILKNYPFKATCAYETLMVGGGVDIKENFRIALKEVDAKIQQQKSARNEKNIFRTLK